MYKKYLLKQKQHFMVSLTLTENAKTKQGKKIQFFSDSQKNIKIPKESAPKRTESNKTKVLKRKETNENVSSKENKDKIINNKENKDKALNSKADDRTSKSRETIKRPFSESDTDESDSPRKRKTNSNKLKGAFCRKQDLIMNGVKRVHLLNHAKKSSCLRLYCLQ